MGKFKVPKTVEKFGFVWRDEEQESVREGIDQCGVLAEVIWDILHPGTITGSEARERIPGESRWTA